MGFKARVADGREALRYWLWEEDAPYKRFVSLECETKMSAWTDGVAFTSAPEPVLVKTTNQKKFADVLRVNRSVPMLSPRAIEILERHGAEADYHPVTVRSHSRDEETRFFRAANVTRLIACLDRGRAKFTTFHGSKDISYLTAFRLIDDKIPRRPDGSGPAWFRLGEFAYFILVSDALKQDIEAAGIAGVRFTEPHLYENRMYSDELPHSKVPQPTWESAAPEPVVEMVTLRGYKGSGQAALRAAMENKPHTPKKGRPVDIEIPRDGEEIHVAYHQLAGVDLDICASMPNLRRVGVGANLLVAVDLAPLARCARLEEIGLNGNRLRSVDLSPLAKVRTLREVRLFGNAELRAVDASPLAACPAFESLIVDTGVDVTGIDAAKVTWR